MTAPICVCDIPAGSITCPVHDKHTPEAARAKHLAIPHVDASGRPAACWHTPEAITAAGNAMREKWLRDHPGIVTLNLDPMDWAAVVLEAAAPLITAAAWRDGYGQGRDDEARNLPLREYAP